MFNLWVSTHTNAKVPVEYIRSYQGCGRHQMIFCFGWTSFCGSSPPLDSILLALCVNLIWYCYDGIAFSGCSRSGQIPETEFLWHSTMRFQQLIDWSELSGGLSSLILYTTSIDVCKGACIFPFCRAFFHV